MSFFFLVFRQLFALTLGIPLPICGLLIHVHQKKYL